MIFIGADFDDVNSHFSSNIIEYFKTDYDLIIDIRNQPGKQYIFSKIKEHLLEHDEKIVLYNAFEDEDFFLYFKSHFPNLILVTFFSDDEWRHYSYDRYIALFSDFSIITGYRDNLKLYEEYGFNNVYLLRWAADEELLKFEPRSSYLYDISFIGAANKKRVSFIRSLKRKGIDIKLFGNGWGKYLDLRSSWGGYLTYEEMLHVISKSKINLNFLWNNVGRTNIKGRTFELPAMGAFQLSGDCEQSELEDIGFFDGVNIAVFNNTDDACDKVEFYLQNDSARKKIAKDSQEFIKKNHTWRHRFEGFLEDIELLSKTNSLFDPDVPPRVLILVSRGIQSVKTEEYRELRVKYVNPDQVANERLLEYDGVMHAQYKASISLEAIYVMVCALKMSDVPVVICNFYLEKLGVKKLQWIRFRQHMMDRYQMLYKLIPLESRIYSGSYYQEHGAQSLMVINKLSRISHIEYPLITLKVGFFRRCILLLFFLNLPALSSGIKEKLSRYNYLGAVLLFVLKLFQKIVYVR